MDNVYNISDRVKQARKNAHMTQKALADKMGVAEITIRKYEYGIRNISLEKASQLAYHLNVPVKWLMFGITDNEVELITRLNIIIDSEIETLLNSKRPNEIVYQKGFIDGLKQAVHILKLNFG